MPAPIPNPPRVAFRHPPYIEQKKSASLSCRPRKTPLPAGGLSLINKALSNPHGLPTTTAVKALESGGYRISEILSLTWADVLPNDRVVVRAKKRGTASILHIEGISALAGLLPPDQRAVPIFDCTYQNVYKHMLRLGYAEHPAGHRNRIVTHQPRHALANVAAVMYGLDVAGQILNHKSTSSIRAYVRWTPPVYQVSSSWDQWYDCFINIAVQPASWSETTSAWQMLLNASDIGVVGIGKGYMPGFLQDYGRGGGEPQSYGWEPGNAIPPRRWILSVYFPEGNVSQAGYVVPPPY